MKGMITSWHVVRHPWSIVRGFGPRCYLRCLLAVIGRRETTFLDIALRRS
jgi:hypothetical protein